MTTDTLNIGINPFVLRQTAESRYSYFAGSWDELLARVKASRLRRPGAREKTLLVEVAPDGFYSGLVVLHGGEKLDCVFAQRPGALPGEVPYLQTRTPGEDKSPAGFVEVVLYHRDLLGENERHFPDGGVAEEEWQIISINARLKPGPEPLTPHAMLRNMAAARGLPEGAGGTPAEYTGEEFFQALLYWRDKVMAG
jgi:hypothetical protein